MATDTLELPRDVAATQPILEQIANEWAVPILGVPCTPPARFNDLKRRLDGIPPQGAAGCGGRTEGRPCRRLVRGHQQGNRI